MPDGFFGSKDVTSVEIARAYLARRGAREVLACYRGLDHRTGRAFATTIQLAQYMCQFW